MSWGQRRVDAGQDGVRFQQFRVVYEDGQIVSRELVREWFDPEPRNTVIYYSTASEPQAVDDGILAQALGVGTDQHSLLYGAAALLRGAPDFERRAPAGDRLALRAAGLERLEVQQLDLPYPPIITVGQPGGRIFPTGDGMGATQVVCAVMSFTRAAGSPPIRTVAEPIATMPGPAGTQDGKTQGVVVLVTRAAG